jgi:hypothetical protein
MEAKNPGRLAPPRAPNLRPSNRIAELWDVAQPVPEHSPNENGMF